MSSYQLSDAKNVDTVFRPTDDIYARLNFSGTRTAHFVQVAHELAARTLIVDGVSKAYAMTGWIAAFFFVEGLKRLDKKVPTWAAYIDAMESAPIKNPFGGTIDYANGARLGTQEMNLSKAVGTSASATWEAVKPLQSITSILAAK